jgi:hypothetical protein
MIQIRELIINNTTFYYDIIKRKYCDGEWSWDGYEHNFFLNKPNHTQKGILFWKYWMPIQKPIFTLEDLDQHNGEIIFNNKSVNLIEKAYRNYKILTDKSIKKLNFN